MNLNHRLTKLETALRAKPEVPKFVVLRPLLKPGTDGPLLVGLVLRGPEGVARLDPRDGETEADFMARARSLA